MALTKKREIVSRDLGYVSHPVSAGVKIFEGALIAATAAGFAQPGTSAANLTVLGRAESDVDNSAGADGDKLVTARLDLAFRYDNDSVAPVTRAHLMADCYIKDDHTVSSDNTDRSRAGKVVDIDDDGVWIVIL